MQFIIFAIIQWSLVLIFAKEKLYYLWKLGFIGVAIILLVDYPLTLLGFYSYPNGLIYLGSLPVFHFVEGLASSILFINWLPDSLIYRFIYIPIASLIFITEELIMKYYGGIVYLRWNTFESYLLILIGLSLFTYLKDLNSSEQPTKLA